MGLRSQFSQTATTQDGARLLSRDEPVDSLATLVTTKLARGVWGKSATAFQTMLTVLTIDRILPRKSCYLYFYTRLVQTRYYLYERTPSSGLLKREEQMVAAGSKREEQCSLQKCIIVGVVYRNNSPYNSNTGRHHSSRLFVAI